MTAVFVFLDAGAGARKSYEQAITSHSPRYHFLHLGHTLAYYDRPSTSSPTHSGPAPQVVTFVAPGHGGIVEVDVNAPTNAITIGKRAMTDVLRRQ
jgi:hypothetical protein